jgi:hypothetical protein
MKIQQLSVFLENRPGAIRTPCRALASAGINILTLSLADTQQFGILRLIVKDWQKAKQVLQQAHCVVNVHEVVAVDVADRPGGLADLLDLLGESKLGIEYMYAFTAGPRGGGKASMIFRFEEPDKAIKALAERGVNAIAPSELFARLGE